jgi:uncharacterized protein (UPF0333 family)
MDDRAQVAMEYLIITALLIAIGAIVALLASSLFSTKESLKSTNGLYAMQAEAMFG